MQVSGWYSGDLHCYLPGGHRRGDLRRNHAASTLDYLIGSFDSDIITMDYRVRGFTRDVNGKKLFLDHPVTSIQDYINGGDSKAL